MIALSFLFLIFIFSFKKVSVVDKGVMCLPYAGQQITEYLGKLLTESGYR